MTVKKLIEKLSQENPDAKVVLYINEEECDASADFVEKATATEDRMRYSKGDNLLETGYLKEDEEFVYIIGNIG